MIRNQELGCNSCRVSHNFGYGVGDDMDDLLAGHEVDA